jgi:hypothetical protein
MSNGHTGPRELPFPGFKSRRGLTLLMQAYEYAQEVKRDIWDFAVEIPVLQRVGFSLSEVRWLVCKGYARHAREITTAQDTCRSFQHQSHLALWKRSCVVLTESGAAFVSRLTGANGADSHLHPVLPTNLTFDSNSSFVVGRLDRSPAENPAALIPCWDCTRQELRLGHEIVKEFKLHSPNQAIILASFEEERWPPRIDDPLPHHEDIEPKQRLHDTIKSLNRNQKSRLIRFRGDGTGQGIRWELSVLVSQKVQLSWH